jgi:hypothetical protein
MPSAWLQGQWRNAGAGTRRWFLLVQQAIEGVVEVFHETVVRGSLKYERVLDWVEHRGYMSL